MSNELIIYPTEKLSKKNKSIFFNNLIKQNINKNILKNLNYEIVEPYGLESSLIKNNFDKLEEVYNKFIKELTVQLNELHLENKSERYWSIILGAWLRDLIWTTYNRYSSIQQTFKKNEINSILTIDDTKYNGLWAPGFKKLHLPKLDVQHTSLIRIDHIVGNVELGQMDRWGEYYENIFGFCTFVRFDETDISTKYSSLKSIVLRSKNWKIKLPINEPAKGIKKSQIEEYLEFNEGPGVQHIAILYWIDKSYY